MIALQINLKSQEKTNRKQIESILESVYVNLENDISHPINTYIDGFRIKDSINDLILSKSVTYDDYVGNPSSFLALGNHLIYEFEPFQFQRQAYDRLMANIENIPDDYIPIVNLLQDVYGKEVPVVNEVALELKSFIDEIEDKYQNNFEWYSASEDKHIKQKIDYMMNDPMHLNDVRRHKNIVNHLSQHLTALKMQISIAYSKIHKDLKHEEPFSVNVERFYFPSKEELEGYEGIYRSSGRSDIVLKSNDYYISDGGNFKLVMADDKFIPVVDPDGAYLEFVRDDKDKVEGLSINIIKETDTLSRFYQKIE